MITFSALSSSVVLNFIFTLSYNRNVQELGKLSYLFYLLLKNEGPQVYPSQAFCRSAQA